MAIGSVNRFRKFGQALRAPGSQDDKGAVLSERHLLGNVSQGTRDGGDAGRQWLT
jgi:hypothetical protein